MMADFWIVIKIDGTDPHYRLAMSWKGGYLSGDSWRINSGIVKYSTNAGQCIFTGASNSAYTVDPTRYGMDTQLASIISNMEDREMPVTVMPKDTNWKEVDWIIHNDK